MSEQERPEQSQEPPGTTAEMTPRPKDDMADYEGRGLLEGRRALITGGDSGIGRAVVVAFAQEGADVAIAYLDEHDDAAHTAKLVEQAGRRVATIPGDLSREDACRHAVATTVDELGGLNIVVLNAAYQQNRDGLDTLPTEEFARVFETNIYALLWTASEAIPHLTAGDTIISTASIQAYNPGPHLIDYAMTKAAQVAFTAALAQELGPKGIRVNAVAPGPIWTPLQPSHGQPIEELPEFGKSTPLGRAGQPTELAPAYVFLASPESSYVIGETLAVTGGMPTP